MGRALCFVLETLIISAIVLMLAAGENEFAAVTAAATILGYGLGRILTNARR